MKLKKPSRRQLLLGGAAVGALGVVGGGYLASAGPEDFFKAMLNARLPGVQISRESIRAFAEDSLKNRNDDFLPKLKVLSAGARAMGYHNLAAAMKDNEAFEVFDREFLTRFLLGSNFFNVADPTKEEIIFVGVPPACANPFARFEPPQAA